MRCEGMRRLGLHWALFARPCNLPIAYDFVMRHAMNPRNIFFIVLALGGIVILFSYRASRSFLEAQAASCQSVQPVRTKQMPNWKKQLRPCSSATKRCEKRT